MAAGKSDVRSNWIKQFLLKLENTLSVLTWILKKCYLPKRLLGHKFVKLSFVWIHSDGW